MSQLININLEGSVNTDTILEDVKVYGEPAPHIKFNGIERDGGLTNVYETETATGQETVYMADGSKVSIDGSGNITLDGVAIGNTSPIGVEKRTNLGNYLDAVLTSSGILALSQVSGSVFKLVELDESGAIINSRNITVTYPITISLILAVRLVRWENIAFSDQIEIGFLLVGSAGSVSYLYREATNTFYTGTGCVVDQTSSYIYKYVSDSRYIFATSLNLASVYVADNALASLAITGNGSILKQKKNGYVRHLLFQQNGITAGNASIVASIGHQTFTAAFTATPLYYTTAVTGTYASFRATWGGCEMLTTNSKVVAPKFFNDKTVAAQSIGTNYYVGRYGKLTNNVEDVTGMSWEFRSVIVDALNSYISVALNNGEGTGTEYADVMGVPLCQVGSLDQTYLPDWTFNGTNVDRLLYRDVVNGFVFVKIGTPAARLQVTDFGVTINTLSPINLVSQATRRLHMGTTDYNGAIVSNTGDAGQYNSTIKMKYFNSPDIGNRTLDGFFYTPGIARPKNYTDDQDFGVTIFKDSLYYRTMLNYSIGHVSSDPEFPIYIPESNIPLPVFGTFTNGAFIFENQTAYLTPGYAGYPIGNYLTGSLTPFQLFSQNYVFDGENIFISPVNFANVLQSTELSPVAVAARAQGLRLLAVSPTVVYFYSDFDRSLFAFDGGRTIQKIKRMNRLEPVTSGVYNVRDNTLLMDTANTFIWVRDGVYSVQSKKAAQTALKYYSTRTGIYMVNASYSWTYTYENPGGSSTIVPFTWQSAYFGPGNNVKSNTLAFIIRLYSETRAQTSWDLKVYGFDEASAWVENKTLTINPADYDIHGFATFRVQPAQQKALAMSLEVSTTSTVDRDLLNQVTIEYNPDAVATVTAARTV